MKLRELLKKSNYLQFKFVDVSKSDFDFHSLSEIKNNKSLDVRLTIWVVKFRWIKNSELR